MATMDGRTDGRAGWVDGKQKSIDFDRVDAN